jgi:hypothetical protein
MHKRLRVFALVTLVLIIAASCSKPKDQASQLGGTQNKNNALTNKGPAASAVAGAPKAGQVNGPAQKGYAALNPLADTAQAKKVGALIKLQSTSYTNPNTWLGVTKDTIKLNFGIDQTNCGVNVIGQAAAAGGALSKEDRFYRKQPADNPTINAEQNEAIANLVRYWNDHVQDLAQDWPNAVQILNKYNKPGHNFYGRKITYDLVDAGSFQCPNKQTSAAITMRDRTHPFSSVVFDVPGQFQNGVGLAKSMKAKMSADKRPMLFGLIDTTDSNLHNFAPFVWNEFQSITRMSQLAAQWICADLKGTGPNKGLWGNGKAVNAADPALRTKTRKFGLVWPSDKNNADTAAADFRKFIKADCGITFDNRTTAFQESSNPVEAGSQAGTIATRFKLAGVTTVIYLIDFFGAFFQNSIFKQQGFKPEYANIGTGWQTNTVQRLFADQDMLDKASMFYTAFGVQGVGYGPGDSFWTYHAYHKISPKTHKACDPRTDVGMDHDSKYCKAPGAIVGWYYSWLPLLAGLIFAGPTITPHNVTAGLQNYPVTRYGVDGPTSDPVAVLVGANGGQYYFITDGSSARWRAGLVSPPPERQLGFPDYPDCQRHYVSWPNGLAPQWEKGGPNYNAWCGSRKWSYGWKDQGKSVAYEPSARSEQKCSDTPSGACERSGYPRWEPILYR